MDIYDLHAENTPDKPAVIAVDRRLSWTDLAQATRKAANALIALGLEEGDRMATFAHNSADLIIASAGARSAGATVVPVNWHLAGPELQYILNDSEAAILLTDSEHFATAVSGLAGTSVNQLAVFGDGAISSDPCPVFVHNWNEIWSRGEDQAPKRSTSFFGSYMMYTSGTTGRPKGAFQSSPPDADVGLRYAEAFGLGWEDIHLVAGPLYHSAPAAFCGMTLAWGATVVVMKRFDPTEALAAIERERVTTTFMAPILLARLLSVPDEIRLRYDTSSLRSLIVAGAPCPFHLKVKTQEAFGDVLFEFYGSTETKAALYIKPEEQLLKPGSCGKPFPGVEVRLARDDGSDASGSQEGEVWVRRNSSTFDAYFGDPKKTSQTIRGDWIRTGDMARKDEDGYYYIVDRVDDMILSGGVNIYPAEIEAALVEHPSVEDCAVYGVADPEWGQSVHALVRLSGDPQPTAGDLSKFLRDRLAGYKIPRSWEFTDDVLRTEDGKLRKRLLRDRDSIPNA